MLKLYDYWRSSACYRLRIAFNLKGIGYDSEEVSLHPDHRAHTSEAFKAINPQQRVPTVIIDGQTHTQSMAILDWLEETYPAPALLPEDSHERLRARAFADTIACDIHPLNNVSVLKYLHEGFAAESEAISEWYASWIIRGFAALEVWAQTRTSEFLFGDTPGLAEICLIPQIYNARRFDVDLSSFPRLVEIDANCQKLEAFQKALPEAVKPA
ncbi:MAG: maleylacetoacetate isomerase [Pseudomonadota bacterium]